MKELPILCSGPEVRAILSGDKTQARRVVTLGRPGTFGHSGTNAYDFHFRGTRRGGTRGAGSGCWQDLRLAALLRLCPFGVPGDRLWGREAFALESSFEVGWYPPPHRDGRPLRLLDDVDGKWWEQPHYRATDPAPDLVVPGKNGPGVRWRPSIHMPRWASRLTLEVTEVRVQQLQDISEEDAIAEGMRWQEPTEDDRRWARERFELGEATDDVTGGVWIAPGTDNGFSPRGHREKWATTARDAFRFTWDSTYARRGPGWVANPWVWAITFTKVTP